MALISHPVECANAGGAASCEHLAAVQVVAFTTSPASAKRSPTLPRYFVEKNAPHSILCSLIILKSTGRLRAEFCEQL